MKAGELVAGKYRLDARLGIGGMGEVWKANHTGTGRDFALKFMHAYAAASPTSRQRFTREARVSAKINHPNVIDIFDVGEVDDGGLFLAMELLEGVSLADAFHAAQPLSVQEFLTVMLDTTRALAAAHAVGVVHRDIKPGNIFLHRDRATGYASAKILDFGISKLGGPDEGNQTKTGAVLGSPRYMSPEQTRSAANVDHRTDLWSVGVILFEGLTGTWPHQGDSFSSLVVAICTVPPASIDQMAPELPEPLRAIVRDCLEPIGKRLQSAGELEARLAAIVADPWFSYLPLPRPLHAPSESTKSVSGVRVRPPLLTTTGGGTAPGSGAAESRRATQPRPDEVQSARAHAQPAEPAPQRASALPQAELYFEDDGQEPTRVRPLAPLDLRSMLAARHPAPAQPPAPVVQPQPPQPPQPNEAAQAALTTTPAIDGGQTVTELRAAGPAFVPRAKTVPMNTAAALQAQLVRAGMVPGPAQEGATGRDSTSAQPPAAPQPAAPQPRAAQANAPPSSDPLVATVSQLTFETRASNVPDSQAPAAEASPVAAGPAQVAAAPVQPRAAGGKGLRVVAAALSLLLVGIVVALVSVLRSAPPIASSGPGTATARPAVAAAAPTVTETATATAIAVTLTAEPTATAEPAPTASAAPSVSASASASASAAPAPSSTASASAKASASATAAPAAEHGKAPSKAPATKGPSRVQQLGSGL